MSGESVSRVPSPPDYRASGIRHTITHRVEGSVARQLVGKDLVRSFQFDGEHLILKATSADEHWTLVLEKNRSY
jgi:hypothetical protein